MKKTVLHHALTGQPKARDFKLITAAPPTCAENGILVQVKYISLDPYIGTRLRGNHMGDQAPIPGQEAIPGAIVGEVIESRDDRFKTGDFIHAMDGHWQEVCALAGNVVTKIDPDAAPLSSYVGVLGMPGLTAWAGVMQLAKVSKGDVFMVNAAAGPVGGTAGQIARLKGAKTVIGIAGGAQKCTQVQEVYGFDACLDYKSPDWQSALKTHAPEGVSVHFENVGADMLAFAVQNMQLYGRAILCGLAAHYHADGPPAMTSIGAVIGKRASLHGLVVYDYYDRWATFRDEIAPWVKTGKIAFIEDRVEGLENAPALMEKLMNGDNIGKCIVAL